MARAPADQLAAKPPPRFFGQVRLAHSHQLHAAHTEQCDILGLQEETRFVPGDFFQCLQILPARFQRNQVPAPAVRADHPEPATQRVERELFTCGEHFERVVGRQRHMAEQAAAEHVNQSSRASCVRNEIKVPLPWAIASGGRGRRRGQAETL